MDYFRLNMFSPLSIAPLNRFSLVCVFFKGTCLILLLWLHLFTIWSSRLLVWLISWRTTVIYILEKYISAVDTSKGRGCVEKINLNPTDVLTGAQVRMVLQKPVPCCATQNAVPLRIRLSVLLPSMDMHIGHQSKCMPAWLYL